MSEPATKAIQNINIARGWLRDDVVVTDNESAEIRAAIRSLDQQIAKVNR